MKAKKHCTNYFQLSILFVLFCCTRRNLGKAWTKILAGTGVASMYPGSFGVR